MFEAVCNIDGKTLWAAVGVTRYVGIDYLGAKTQTVSLNGRAAVSVRKIPHKSDRDFAPKRSEDGAKRKTGRTNERQLSGHKRTNDQRRRGGARRGGRCCPETGGLSASR